MERTNKKKEQKTAQFETVQQNKLIEVFDATCIIVTFPGKIFFSWAINYILFFKLQLFDHIIRGRVRFQMVKGPGKPEAQ